MSYEVVVEQTNNKHTRAYHKQNMIVVRLAKGLNAKQKEQHITELVERMTKKITYPTSPYCYSTI